MGLLIVSIITIVIISAMIQEIRRINKNTNQNSNKEVEKPIVGNQAKFEAYLSAKSHQGYKHRPFSDVDRILEKALTQKSYESYGVDIPCWLDPTNIMFYISPFSPWNLWDENLNPITGFTDQDIDDCCDLNIDVVDSDGIVDTPQYDCQPAGIYESYSSYDSGGYDSGGGCD